MSLILNNWALIVNFVLNSRFAKIKKNKQKIEDFRDQLKSTDQSKHDEEQVFIMKTCQCNIQIFPKM